MNTPSKSEIFKNAHAQAKRDANSIKKYAVCFAAALKSQYATVRMNKKAEIEMAAVYAARKEKNTTAAKALKATKGFNGKIYGSEGNYSYYINGKKFSATNEVVAAFNELETETTNTVHPQSIAARKGGFAGFMACHGSQDDWEEQNDQKW